MRAPAAAPRAHGQPGTLIVLEGIDRSGRSTHVGLLEQHLRYRGRAVTRTSLATSALAGEEIRRVQRGVSVGATATALLYAADLAERIEQIVMPSLKAGLVVLADRYVYTPMARAEARGTDHAWLDEVFSWAPAPDAVLLLDVDAETSVSRWASDHPHHAEARLDVSLTTDRLESYRLFQARLARWFERHGPTYGFTPVKATASVARVQRLLADHVDGLIGSTVSPGRRRTTRR